MSKRFKRVKVALLAVGLLFSAVGAAGQEVRRDEVAHELLRWERLLSGARFEIPSGLYHQYLKDLHAPDKGPDSPVPFVAESGTYHLTVGADVRATLLAKVRLRVFAPYKCLNIPILGAKDIIWEDLSADDKGAILTTTDGWVHFSAPRPGVYTITGRLHPVGTVGLDVIRTVRTAVVFDSPLAWEVQPEDRLGAALTGTAEKGTHGRFALKPTNKLRIKYTLPMPRRQRLPRYSLRGEVAWNLAAGAQQVTALLTTTISAGASDRITLLLPAGADRVKITGPEVRKVQVSPGRAVVHLRGKVLGQTVLKVTCELPAGDGPNRRFARLGVAGGHWTGGTLVVTNSAGGSEVIPAEIRGLREMSPAEIPAAAKAILPAPAVIAYEITSREFSAEVEVISLGRFALRQSVADLAHYEVFLSRDGAVICRARYEIRNRNKQFLRFDLPPGSRVLLARVNEKSRPISQARGKKNEWLLPLERSSTSVMGLVSFPVEVVFVCKTARLSQAGLAEIPLPAIDLPIAYGWCETYMPTSLEVEKWSGVMKKVSRFTSETATASLDYGWGEMAAGYTEKDRPTVPPAPKPDHKKIPREYEPASIVHAGPMLAPRPEPTLLPTTRPAASQPSGRHKREARIPILSKIPMLGRIATNRAKVRDEKTRLVLVKPILAKNYYRAGKDYYDKADYANAADYLEQVVKLAPGSAEARNASRLLANPQMPKGRKLKLKTQAEKAAARVVRHEVEQSNILLVGGQKGYIRAGQAAVREGRYKEAAEQFKAAQSATEQLIARGAAPKETRERLQKAQLEMAQLREQTTARISSLRKSMGELKKSGEYEKALKMGRKLRKYTYDMESEDSEGSATGAAATRPAQRRRRDGKELRKEMEALAVAASRKRQEHARSVKAAQSPAVITSLERPRRIRKDEVEARYAQAFQRARKAVQAKDLDRAGEEVNYARTLLATNKSLLSDTEYRARKADTDKMLAYVNKVKAKWQKEQVALQRAEIEQGKRRRELVMTRRKSEKIAMLKQQARTLRDEQKFRQAIEVCDEIRKLDPDDKWANEWYAQLSRFVLLLEAKADKAPMQEEVKRLNDIRRSLTARRPPQDLPWAELLRYPRDWSEITARRKPAGAGQIAESEPVRTVRRRLRERLPELNFSGIKFEDVVQFFRDVSNCSIHVKWTSLEAAGIDKAATVNVHLTNVTFAKALQTVLDDVGGVNPLGFEVDEGVIVISTRDDLSTKTITRIYDIRDLVIRTPSFAGPKIDVSAADDNAAGGIWEGDDDDDDADENAPSRDESANDLLDLIRSTIAPDVWRDAGGTAGSIHEMGGQIIVTQTEENQRALADLLSQLREARGPQVEEGEKIAQQKAGGSFLDDIQVDFPKEHLDRDARTVTALPRLTTYNGQRAYVMDKDGGWRYGGRVVRIKDKELDSFIRRNYDWALKGDPLVEAMIPDSGTLLVGGGRQSVSGLVGKLEYNLGQKVVVNSINVNTDVRDAAALGVRFVRGGNNVNWAVINDAQLRSLIELDAATRRSSRTVAANNRLQETIVGTDARLANDMIANVSFAGDAGNILDINGNSVSLSHGAYLAIYNGRYLTVVQAGPMQHWREKPAVTWFVEVPQNIEPPCVGRLVRFERTLLKPSDKMVLRAEYKWKGEQR